MNEIFVSYRRNDSQEVTNRIYNKLAETFGEAAIFRDVDKILRGDDFRAAIEQALINCKIMLVIIGPGWLNAEDNSGKRRLDNPADFVRMEVEMGLRHRSVRVIPVLVKDAGMPPADHLPPSMYNLAFANAARLRPDPYFDTDMEDLIADLHPTISSDKGRRSRVGVLVTTIALVAVTIIILVIQTNQQEVISSQNLTLTASVPGHLDEVTLTNVDVETNTAAPSATSSSIPMPSPTPTTTFTQTPAFLKHWAIIFSNDGSLEEAQFEANRAINLGYEETTIYRTTSWYVTAVLHFSSQVEAQQSLRSDEILQANRPNAYVDDLARLCPTQTLEGLYG